MHPPLHILVVDDDPALATAARALLSRRECHIDAVFSGIDAVARVRAGGIDALLLDVFMPEVDGLSVLDEIGRLSNPPRVVLMSGNPAVEVEQVVASGRALACLTKPVDFNLALALLLNEAPERPLQLKPELGPAELSAFAAAAVRGTAFLEGAPQLPPKTVVSITLELPSGELELLAVSDPAARPAQRRGLGLRLAELTDAKVRALRAVVAPPPESVPVRAEAQPNRAQELYRRGLEKLETGKYETALLDLRAARDLEPGNALLAAACARTEELAGVEKARALFREAETLAEKEPRTALRKVEDAIRLDPTRASYHREAARLLLFLGDSVELAEERLAAAIHLAPSDPSPRLHLAQLLERAGRPREALWAVEAALHLFPSDPELNKVASRLRRKVV
jgi:CheY-like chemotaxis protein